MEIFFLQYVRCNQLLRFEKKLQWQLYNFVFSTKQTKKIKINTIQKCTSYYYFLTLSSTKIIMIS